MTRINEAKVLRKHILYDWKYKFYSKKCNSKQKWNNDKCRCECKKCHVCKKNFIRNPSTLTCKIGAYLKSIDDDWKIIC